MINSRAPSHFGTTKKMVPSGIRVPFEKEVITSNFEAKP
jgi:hypothetical protein